MAEPGTGRFFDIAFEKKYSRKVGETVETYNTVLFELVAETSLLIDEM